MESHDTPTTPDRSLGRTLDRSLDRRGFLGRAAAATLALALGRLGALAQGSGTTATAKTLGNMELAVTVEIAAAEGGRYHRPYVAVWIEDEDGKPVRNLSLWAQTTGRGPRYLPELRRWFRSNADLADTISSATRNPGRYTLVWDGKTDRGAAAEPGTYHVCVESAREHGPYGLVREAVTLGAAAQKKQFGGDGDIAGVALEYRKRA